jgi:hypothetical protein
MPKPDFLIVGAAKSGTSAMCDYLHQHPAIFISPSKEPHFFGTDLWRHQERTLEQYLALFEPGRELLCGEGSTRYLYSSRAAQEIYYFNPEAKIIIMLRNPVDFMYSLHNQRLYEGNEDIEDFAQALAVEAKRQQGRDLPKTCPHPQLIAYTESARFSQQVERYFNVFGRERVHIIIYDDFKNNTAQTYRETLAFLGVDSAFQANFQVVNPSKYWRNKGLISFMRTPPLSIRKLVRMVVPFQARVELGKVVNRINTEYRPRPSMDPALRRRLQQQFAPEVEQLSALLGRDLTHWNTA